jgi:hypothetical protein
MIVEIWDPIRLVMCMKVFVISEKIIGCQRRSPILRTTNRRVDSVLRRVFEAWDLFLLMFMTMK